MNTNSVLRAKNRMILGFQRPIVIRNNKSEMIAYNPEIAVDVASRANALDPGAKNENGKPSSIQIFPVKNIQKPINPIRATPAITFQNENSSLISLR